jgi:hypothetical protein
MLRKFLIVLSVLGPSVSHGAPLGDQYSVRSGAVNARIGGVERDLFIAAELRKAMNFLSSASGLSNCMTESPVPVRRFDQCVGAVEFALEQTGFAKVALSQAVHAAKDPSIRESAERVLGDVTTFETNLLKVRSGLRPIIGANALYPDAPIAGFESIDLRRSFCTKKLTEVQRSQAQYRAEFDTHVRVGDVHLMRSDFVNTKALWDGMRFLAGRCLVTKDEALRGITLADLSAALYQAQIDSLNQTLQYMWNQSQTIPVTEFISRACVHLRPENKARLTDVCGGQDLNFHSEYALHLGLTTDLSKAGGGK